MLRILRNKKTAKKVWIGLAIIIIPAFTLWGFSGAFRSKEESKPIGKIAGRQITPLEFKNSLSAVNVSAIMQFGDKLPEIEKYLNLQSQAWARLVLLYEAKRRAIKVSDDEVIDAIQNNPAFQSSDKTFSDRIYDQALRYAFRIQGRAFEEQTRQGLTLQKLYLQITDGINVDEKQIRSDYELANQEVSISCVSSLIADFTKKINPDEKQIKDYYEKNKEIFTDPLSTIKDKVKEMLVNDTAKNFAEEKIKKCAEFSKEGALNQAADKCGLKVNDPAPFKITGTIKEIGQTDVLWQKAKTLKPKQISEIIKTSAGFFIIQLKSILPIDEKKFEKEKADFSNKLIQQKKQERFNEFTTELTKKSPASF